MSKLGGRNIYVPEQKSAFIFHGLFLFLINRCDYIMTTSKENSYIPTKNDYIVYLYKECKSKLVNPKEKIYDDILKFVQSPEGKIGFKQFQSLDPEKIGIHKKPEVNPVKKAFQL